MKNCGNRIPTFNGRNVSDFDQKLQLDLEYKLNYNQLPIIVDQQCILSESSIEKLKQQPTMKTSQKHSRSNSQSASKSKYKFQNQEKKFGSYKNTQPKTPNPQDKHSFSKHKHHLSSTQNKKIYFQESTYKIQPLCQQLSYTIGYLKAQLQQTRKMLDEEKDKRQREAKHLLMIAENYRQQAEKYKKLLKKTNISVQEIKKYGLCRDNQGHRYSHF